MLIGSGNGLAPKSDTPFSEPMLTLIPDVIGRHYTVMDHPHKLLT